MKKYLSILLAVISVLFFVACGNQQSEVETTDPTAQAEKSKSTQEETSSWKDYYRNILTNKNYDYFDLVYIDNDDIPELFVSWEDCSTDGGVLYLPVVDGANNEGASYPVGYNGTVEYVEKGNVICWDYTINGNIESHKIEENNKLEKVWEGKYGTEEEPIDGYYSNGEKVSQEEYNKMLNEYYPGIRKEANRILITEENIHKYLGWYRLYII